jgi:hypothetical protein
VRPAPKLRAPILAAVVVLSAVVLPAPATAQGTSGPTVRDSNVGYIDPAIPGNVFRFRVDEANDDNVPSRAEFFYAKSGPLGPGLPRPEPRVDYQDLSSYLEVTAAERLSVFVEVPYRFLQTEVNGNADGFTDMNAGFKYAFISGPDLVATFQLRTYVPIGDARRGLGTDHASLEPAFLLFAPLTDRLRFEGELRDWVPVGGTDFAGDVIRYGLGFGYDVVKTEGFRLSPVVELVGWTVLGGKESIIFPSGVVDVEGAAGDTIINAKVGARMRFGERSDIYAGYGRPLTGDVWYKDTVRVEYRLSF